MNIQIDNKWIFRTVVGAVITLLGYFGDGYLSQIIENQITLQKDVGELLENVHDLELEFVRSTGVDSKLIYQYEELEKRVEKIEDKI